MEILANKTRNEPIRVRQRAVGGAHSLQCVIHLHFCNNYQQQKQIPNKEWKNKVGKKTGDL